MIEISLLVSLVSAGFAIFAGVVSMKRTKTTDDKKEATEMTTVIVKLENIGNDTKEIKSELRSVRKEVGDLRERIIVAEQATKALHERVDKHELKLESINFKEE